MNRLLPTYIPESSWAVMRSESLGQGPKEESTSQRDNSEYGLSRIVARSWGESGVWSDCIMGLGFLLGMMKCSGIRE